MEGFHRCEVGVYFLDRVKDRVMVECIALFGGPYGAFFGVNKRLVGDHFVFTHQLIIYT